MNDPCPNCKPGSFCRTMACGRLKVNKAYFDETPEQEVIRLRAHIAKLEKKISDLNWTLYPDRMGQ